jgi:hypothetical protein
MKYLILLLPLLTGCVSNETRDNLIIREFGAAGGAAALLYGADANLGGCSVGVNGKLPKGLRVHYEGDKCEVWYGD